MAARKQMRRCNCYLSCS